MADPGIGFRQYQEDGSTRSPGKPIAITKSKTDYSSMEKEHPDDALNEEYIAAGAADDHETPLCMKSLCVKLESHRGRCRLPNV